MQKHPASYKWKEDPIRKKAKEDIRKLFIDEYNRPKRTPYYISQLQTILEKNYFDRIVYNAAMDLVQDSFLMKLEVQTKYASKMVFFYNKRLENERDKPKVIKHIKSISKLVDKHANPKVTEILGRNLEGLVKYELRAQGFENIKPDSNEFRGKRWTETDHNLDFIAEHKSGKLNVGIEVKNAMAVMDLEEIDLKIKMCRFLELVPVFAVRWIKPHQEHINTQGGFCWVFKTQIFPLGFEELTKRLWHQLKIPVIVRTDLPEKSIRLFENWVKLRTCNH